MDMSKFYELKKKELIVNKSMGARAGQKRVRPTNDPVNSNNG